MNSLTKAAVIVLLLVLVGFTIVSNEVEATKTPVVSEEINIVNEDTKEASTSFISYLDQGTMTASWYGPRFHGRKTANGEVYDQMAYTAAHKSLKFGTLLRVTNPKNNKSVIVRINDRGPYKGSRNLDLSKACAIDLDMLHNGVAKLKVEQVRFKGINFPIISLN